MPYTSRTSASWVPYPAAITAAGRTFESSHAPLAPRMAHRQQHGPSSVAHHVAHDVARDAALNPVPGTPDLAAGARPIGIPARAAALMLRQNAIGLRALGLKPASLLRTALTSLPAPGSRRAPAGQGQNQKQSSAQDGHSIRCERSLSVRNVCACAAAPDCPPFLRFAQSYHAGSRARFALNRPRSLGSARKEGANRQIKTRLAGVRSQRRLLISLRRWGGCARWLPKRAGERSLFCGRRSESFMAARCSIGRLPQNKLRSGCERSPENTQLAEQTLDQSQSKLFLSMSQMSPIHIKEQSIRHASH
jgi:hypothetical protein